MYAFKKFFFLLSITLIGVLSSSFLAAQPFDSLRLMTYNLMFYQETTSFCTSTNNNPGNKEQYLKEILDYAAPDILSVNEMGTSISSAPYTLLNKAINKNGRNFWFANSSRNSRQSLMNMLYFNDDKLGLKGQFYIDKNINNKAIVRHIDVYQLYYKSPNLGQNKDTVFINIIAAHLKAGSGNADKVKRANATAAVMAKLDSMNVSGNYFFVGDLNLYNSNEAAFQNLTNYIKPSLRFQDPVNISGNWSNANYSSLHTQSTHTSGGCFSGGGMDDRFDFILVSNEVMNNTDHLKYIANSYQVLGQDGLRYNSSLISPPNASAPASIITALYNMSDHLPVMLDLELSLPTKAGIKKYEGLQKPSFQNPTSGRINLDLTNLQKQISVVKVMDMQGKVLYQKKILNHNKKIKLNLEGLGPGMYLLKLRSIKGLQRVDKFVIN